MSFDALFTHIPKGKYEPVLDHRRRCQILALLRRGISAATLSQQFGVNRHTVHSIGRPNSPHYRSVRADYDALGREAFEAQHLDEAVCREALALQQGDVDSRQGVREPIKASLYNPRANAKQGPHDVEDVSGFTLSVVIFFGQPIDGKPKAWYYKEDDGEAVGPYYTSTLAYQGARDTKTQEELDA